MKENVSHPKHYGGKENPYEAIKVIEAWGIRVLFGEHLNTFSVREERSSERT